MGEKTLSGYARISPDMEGGDLPAQHYQLYEKRRHWAQGAGITDIYPQQGGRMGPTLRNIINDRIAGRRKAHIAQRCLT